LIEEDVRDSLNLGLRFIALDHIDPTRRLSDLVPVVGLHRGSTMNWRTRAEHAKSPNGGTIAMRVRDHIIMQLTPSHRPRAALSQAADVLAEDFTVLLRREVRDKVW
jgi:hypothetical protein